MPTLPNVLCAPVGIEMEFNFHPSVCTRRLYQLGHTNIPELYANRVQCPGIVNAKTRRDWVIHNEHCGIEFSQRKPSRQGPALERKIANLCDSVRRSKGVLGGVDQCGVHVHIQLPETLLAVGQYGRANIEPNYGRFLLWHERFFIYCVPRSRQFGYNPPFLTSTYEIAQHHRQPRAGAGTLQLLPPNDNPSGHLCARRWCHAVSEFGTIEFRLLEGTEDAERVINWIALIEFIHRKAMHGELPPSMLYLDSDDKQTVLAKMHAFFQFPQHIHNWLLAQYANPNH